MITLRMTDRWLKTVCVETGREEYTDAIAKGLRLRVYSRSKKWSVLTGRNGKQLRVPLGSYPEVGLAEARERANVILSDASRPDFEAIIDRLSTKETPLLESLCSDYIDQMKAKGQKSHKEYQRALIDSPTSFCNFVEAKIGEAPRVGDVRTAHVTEWLRDIYQRAPSHARHCRAYLGVFQLALEQTSASRRQTQSDPRCGTVDTRVIQKRFEERIAIRYGMAAISYRRLPPANSIRTTKLAPWSGMLLGTCGMATMLG